MYTTHPFTAPGVVAKIIVTDANHIYFDANDNSGAGILDPSAHYIEIRGILYSVSAHLYRWSDGTWNLGEEKNNPNLARYHALYMSRPLSNIEPSNAARKTAAEKIIAIVREWAMQNPAALADAEQNHQQEQLGKKRELLAAKQAEARQIEQEIAALKAEPKVNSNTETDAYTGEPFSQREQALIDLLWDYLKKDSEYKDRRQTGYGTKTKRGLVASIDQIINQSRG